MARREVTKPDDKAGDLSVLIPKQYWADPLGFVLFAYPWGKEGTSLHDQDGPDHWQVRVLAELGAQVAKAATSDMGAIRLAIASGHGIGKTTLVAWVIHWFLSTRHGGICNVTANTQVQLETKSWRELSKWLRLAINTDWFVFTATKVYVKGRQDDWFAKAIPWSENRPEAMAGTHDAAVLIVMDEASAIPDAIWESVEGAQTTRGMIWIVAGNPTRGSGRFRECFRDLKHRWRRMRVDSRKAKVANQAQIQEWIDDYGEDSDFVRVRVKGEFPRASTQQFISEDVVRAAVERGKALDVAAAMTNRPPADPELLEQMIDPDLDLMQVDEIRVIAVDPARFGGDSTVIGLRTDSRFTVLAALQGKRTTEVASIVAGYADTLRPDAIMVDGTGIGAGVVDRLVDLHYPVVDVVSSESADDEVMYFNKRAEAYGLAREWLTRVGAIDDHKELKADLQTIEYGLSMKNQIQLERKQDVKKRLGRSPDHGDCLAISFGAPVRARVQSADKIARLKRFANTSSIPGRTWMSD